MSERKNKKRFRLRKLIVIALLIGTSLFFFYQVNRPARQATDSPPSTPPSSSQANLVLVTSVEDGDTIKVRLPTGEDSIQIMGIDTPETSPAQCFGTEARDHTSRRLAGQRVRLEIDPINKNRDRRGNLLRYVYLDDGTFYNAELVREGYAFEYPLLKSSKQAEFQRLEQEARTDNRGLWGDCKVDTSDEVKQTAGRK